jgi:hydroxypyruvate reductase
VKSNDKKLRRDARAIFDAALSAADAGNAVRNHLRLACGELRAGNARFHLRNFHRVFLLAVGKAAVPMSKAISEILGTNLDGGLILTKDGHSAEKLKPLEIFESSHPIPDERGVQVSQIIHTLLAELNARDLLICAISGGASALLPAPAVGLGLEEKQKTTELLLRAGANIHELNTVRKHLSRLKGGRLAALAYPATVLSLLLSDVIGDDPDVIGSGPTVPDSSTFRDALSVLDKFHLVEQVPESVRTHLENGNAGTLTETPKPGDPLFENVSNIIVGSNRFALSAAAAQAKKLGYRPLILSSTMQGEAREVARAHAEILREIRSSGNPVKPPACVLSGGETTVSVHGKGKGGRNQEFALAAAIEIAALPDVLVLSAGTDGTDGPTDAAGAIATGSTLDRAKKLGLNPHDHLNQNDSYPFFERLGDLVKTGPTGTNVMDVHLLLAHD